MKWLVCCFLIIVHLIYGCHILYRPNFRIKEPVNLEQITLRLNGVYISTYKDRQASIFLYANGNTHGTRNSEDDDLYSYYQNGDNIQRMNEVSASYPIGWGKYYIKGESLLIEQIWMKNNNYRVLQYEGRIINDTTILVKDYFHNADSIFYFYPLEHKPDSVSRYVE